MRYYEIHACHAAALKHVEKLQQEALSAPAALKKITGVFEDDASWSRVFSALVDQQLEVLHQRRAAHCGDAR